MHKTLIFLKLLFAGSLLIIALQHTDVAVSEDLANNRLYKTNYKLDTLSIYCSEDLETFVLKRSKLIHFKVFQRSYLRKIRNLVERKIRKNKLKKLHRKIIRFCSTTQLPINTPTPIDINSDPTPIPINTPTSTPTEIPVTMSCGEMFDNIIKAEVPPILPIIPCLSPNIHDVKLVHQQSYPSSDKQMIGLKYDGISLSSRRFAAANYQSLEEVLAATADEIQSALESTEVDIAGFSLNTENMVIIDIENSIHPRIWYTFEESLRERVYKAYKLRLEIARLKMPKAFLVVYGFPTPNGKGTDTTLQIQSFIEASEFGVFDSIDAVMPALHMRFGAGDIGYEESFNIQKQAVEVAHLIRRSSGAYLPIVPLLSLRVNNGQSAHNAMLVSPLDTARQFKFLQPFSNRISNIVIWTAFEGDIDVEAHLIDAFIAYDKIP